MRPFSERLSAWWLAFQRRISGDAAGPEAPARPTTRLEQNISARAKVVQRVWGDGMHLPGGMSFYTEMLDFLNLKPKHRLAHLGAGLGGLGNHLHHQRQIDVDGYETDQDFASASAALFPPPEGRAVEWLPADGPPPALAPEAYDAVLCHEALLPIVDKSQWLNRLSASLKPGGRIVLLEMLAGEDVRTAAGLPAMTAWRRGERMAPDAWKLTRFIRGLEQTGFTIAVALDLSAEYRDRAISGYGLFLKGITPEDLAPSLRDALMAETELWSRRSAAIEAGGLRVVQITATRG